MSNASSMEVSEDENQPPSRPMITIYSKSDDHVSSYWREKYERDARKNWDIFYKRHGNRFFKDRHYLEKEWGHYFSGNRRTVILETGCGAGNTIFPLLETYPNLYFHACDFSQRAVDLVKRHSDFSEGKVNAFVCDLTMDDLGEHISPSSVDAVTMIFVLSAVAPEKMPLVLQNVRKVLKPNGCILFRDYAIGDLAQLRFTGKRQQISENFYVRGDGTRAFYFTEEFLQKLFNEIGFNMVEHVLYRQQLENRSSNVVMNRRWFQAVFQYDGFHLSDSSSGNEKPKDAENGYDIYMSEGIALEMFGPSPSSGEIFDVAIRDHCFKIKMLSKENQHTCSSTGLMLWESSRLMAQILAANLEIVSGKRVLELGCGCSGICSMIAATSAEVVVATDGDTGALEILRANIASNLDSLFVDKLIVRKLEWGNKTDISSIKQQNEKGFDVIIGTDITYVPEAIQSLFSTARQLISEEVTKPALILSHILRRVDEPSLTSAAYNHGFQLVDRWPMLTVSGNIIQNWLFDGLEEVSSTALSIMYFEYND